MEAAAQKAPQPGPQEPAPQPEGQLELLALGQDQELPEDQDLGDHDPGAVEQDDALEFAKPEEIPISYFCKRRLFYGERTFLLSCPSCTWARMDSTRLWFAS